jgi:hypothetical protein
MSIFPGEVSWSSRSRDIFYGVQIYNTSGSQRPAVVFVTSLFAL